MEAGLRQSGAGWPLGAVVTLFDHIRKSASLRLAGLRILLALPVLWGVTFLTFLLMNLLPGTAAEALAGPGASQETVKNLAVRLHLNLPFFSRYWHWLSSAATGHLGNSLESGQSVASILATRVPVTFELVVLAFVLSIGCAIPFALLAVRKPHGIADRLCMLVSVSGLAMPGFILALLLSLLFAVKLKLVPTLGFVPLNKGILANLRTMVLPAVALGFALFAHYVRILRADLLDQVVGQDYIVTAHAKGIAPFKVLTRHALRNSAFPLLTIVGVNFGVLVGGTVIIEEIFGLPGLGQSLILAIQVKDATLVEGIVFVMALAVVMANLVTDILYSVLDPRIRHDSSAN